MDKLICDIMDGIKRDMKKEDCSDLGKEVLAISCIFAAFLVFCFV